MALIDTLNASLNFYDDLDNGWRQFILDHLIYLQTQSDTATISNSYMQSCSFSLKRYLRSINYSTNWAWIVGLVNNIPTDVQFTFGVNSLYLPTNTVLQRLYTDYCAAKQTVS